MDFEFNKDLEKIPERIKENKEIEKFISELTDYLDDFKQEIFNRLPQNCESKQSNLKIENCLYQVVGLTSKGAYLQNTQNDIIFEETNISEELKSIISNDYILRYEDGNYKFEEEITEDFYKKMVEITEYQNIKEKFEKESNILDLDSNTRFKILSQDNKYTTLIYDNEKIKVPNELIPYFADKNSVLLYDRSGRFLRIK